MTDFLTRIARHALGLTPTAQLLGRPRYALGGADVVEEVVEQPDRVETPAGTPASRRLARERLAPTPAADEARAQADVGTPASRRLSRERLAPVPAAEKEDRGETPPAQPAGHQHSTTNPAQIEDLTPRATRAAAEKGGETPPGQPAGRQRSVTNPAPIEDLTPHAARIAEPPGTPAARRLARERLAPALAAAEDDRGETPPAQPAGRQRSTTIATQAEPSQPAERLRSTTAAEPPTPTVHVTIGRVEVRAAQPPSPPPAPPPAPTPRISLDDYLREHKGRRP